MKTERSTIRYIVISITFLVLVLVFLLLGEEFIRENIVLPFEYDLWLAKIAVRSIPQYIFLAIICGIALIFVFYSLFSGKTKLLQKPENKEFCRNRSERVVFWVTQVRVMRRGNYSLIRFSDFFSRLIFDILSYTGRINPDNFEENLINGNLDVSPEIISFLKLRSMRFFNQKSKNPFIRLKTLLSHLLSFRKNSKVTRNTAEKVASHEMELQLAVSYLEHELEVSREHYGNK
jgi:hypothetical protein